MHSVPRISANVSAVFMLVSAAPIFCGIYVTRARIGFMRALCHVGDCKASAEFISRRHSVTAAVIMGCGISSEAGVRPPSTDINSGRGGVLLFQQRFQVLGA